MTRTDDTAQDIPLASTEPQIHMHIKALDGVRALSIILVVLTHTAPLGPKAWQFNSMAGPMGMSLFFCLSGFLIISILHRNADVLSFYVRRLLRIVPSVALYVVLMVIFFGLSWRGVAENLLFVSNYFFEGRGRGETAAPMTHLWSLSVEVQFYVAIGLAVLLLGRRGIYMVIPAAIAVTGLRISSEIYINIATHLRVDEILAGALLALAVIHFSGWLTAAFRRTAPAVTVLVVLTLLWMLSCHPSGGALQFFRPYFAASLVGVVIFARVPLLHAVLESRPAAYVARISYALYIYHPLTVWGWMDEGSTVERYLVKRPFSWLASWALAHASTFYWEAPWQALARRLTRGRKPVTSA